MVDQVVNKGPINVVLDICRHLNRDNFNPIVFSLRNESPINSIENAFVKLNIEIVHFGFRMLEQELQTYKVANIVKTRFIEKKGSILHAHCFHPQIIASLIKDINIVSTIHNISGEDYVMKKGKILGHYMAWRFGLSLPKIDCCVAISDYMMDYYNGKCKSLIKISNGVSFKRNELFDGHTFKKSLNVHCEYPIIVVTGSVIARKNVTFIVSELKSLSNQFTCIIVGDGNQIDACKCIAGPDSRFRFEGFRNNVLDYLNIADYYISASKSEGLPLSVLEAIHVGIPCLLSDIPPHGEIVNNMDVEGVEVFSLEKGALKSAFARVLTREIDSSCISKKAHSLYGAEIMTQKYESLYEQIINK